MLPRPNCYTSIRSTTPRWLARFTYMHRAHLRPSSSSRGTYKRGPLSAYGSNSGGYRRRWRRCSRSRFARTKRPHGGMRSSAHNLRPLFLTNYFIGNRGTSSCGSFGRLYRAALRRCFSGYWRL